ncbi:MAG TPA: hypothetical protein VLY63_25330 [Anaerolineae bacterium]|nr:hypothetical protein [Anaerolineae bacterium]
MQIIGFMVLWILVLGGVYALVVRPWHLHRGATKDEVQRSLPGDDLVPNPKFVWNQAITINAPASEIWPWVVQIGNQRAGWYSWDGIHRLLGVAGSVDYPDRSADRIIPELQDLQVGDEIRMMPEDMGAPGYAVVSIDPDRALVTHIDDENAATWVWVLEPIDAESTRLIVRFRQKWGSGLMGLTFWIGDELGSLVMQPKTLSGIKQRAEAAAGQ